MLLLLQVVVFDTRVKTPQVGLFALAKALTQKGVAKKIQVPVLTLSVSSVQDVSGSLLFLPLKTSILISRVSNSVAGLFLPVYLKLCSY